MTTIETLIVIILTIVSLPYLCKLINRPSLLYCAYILVGVVCGNFLGLYTFTMLHEVGNIGFTLLLFLLGLEIELPSKQTLKKSMPFCIAWFAIQLPLLALAGWAANLSWGFIIIASSGITACSLSIAYGILKGQSDAIGKSTTTNIVVKMVALELIALVILAVSDVVYAHGWGKEVLVQALSLLFFVFLIRIFSQTIHKQLSRLVEAQGKWEIHYLLLVVFLVAIIGERLGLSAPKTAFFLGLFMSETSHSGVKFEDVLQPLAKGILIPIFFLSLGTTISLQGLFPWVLPIALTITVILFSVRYYLFNNLFNHNLATKYFLLYCPNITMAAVAAEILIHHQAPKEQVDLILVTGLLMTLSPAFIFPSPQEEVEPQNFPSSTDQEPAELAHSAS